MGCGSSMDNNSIMEEPSTQAVGPYQWPLVQATRAEVVREFVRLDERISKMETTCPGPRLATAEAWLQHLQAQRDALVGVPNREPQKRFVDVAQESSQPSQQLLGPARNSYALHTQFNETEGHNSVALNVQQENDPFPFGSNVSDGHNSVDHMSIGRFPPYNVAAQTPTQDLLNLALNLGVVNDVRKASTHEDFFARLSESALHLVTLDCYTAILEHSKVRLKLLTDSYAELNELYVKQDGIIAFICGGTYLSRLEESLDGRLEAARDVRDKLGSTLEQWHICGTLLKASASAATMGLKHWRRLLDIVNPKDKMQAALICRNALQASLISLQCAQLSLPNVELKHTSNRQIVAVKHCITYMMTDIANVARYDHTSHVFSAYESSVCQAVTWLYETFNKTLRQDFDRAEQTVHKLSKNLRDHREDIFAAAPK